MKKTLSKRVLSLFLSVLILATSLPFAGMTASAASLPESKSGAYLLAYFKNSAKSSGSLVGESVYFALSKDGYNFEALNTQNPVVYATQDSTANGTVYGSGHARDPYIIRGDAADENGGKYSYMLATDDDTTGGDYSNTSLHIWRSADLVNWEYVSNIELVSKTGGDKAWAPQAIWDSTVNQYMIYWSGNCDGQDGILYAYTKDFVNLTSDPQVLFKLNNGHPIIDGDITKTETGYIMYFKDESSDQTGSKQIHYTTKTGESPSPSDGEYTQSYTALDAVRLTKMEGPQLYNIAGTESYVLLADKFENNSGFNAYVTSDFKTYVALDESAGEFTLNHLGLSHGSVLQITDEEYTALTNAYGREVSTQTNIPANDSVLNHLVAQYFVKQNPAEDNSGKENHIGDYNGDGITDDAGAVNNLNMVVKDGRLCAQFVSNGATSGTQNNKTGRNKGSYAWFETAKMLQNADFRTGVTISFETYFDSAPADTHIFDVHDGGDFAGFFTKLPYAGGTQPKDYHNLLNETDGQVYAYNGTDMTDYGDFNFGKMSTQEWHRYTISVTNKYISIYLDNVLKDRKVISRANEDWFNSIFKNGNTTKNTTSKICVGISSFINDDMLDGYISNFCIFDRALSEADVNEAMALLDKAPEESYDTSDVIYKDSCQNYTDNTYVDSIYGNTLALNNTAVTSSADPVNDKAEAKATNGYTYSMMYNPGNTIDSGSVFKMGDDANGTFTINEDGTIAFRKGEDFFTTPSLFTLKEDTFQYVTLQVVPYADYDRIYVYINGQQTNMYDCYKLIEDTSTGSTYPRTSSTDSTIFNLGDFLHSTYTTPLGVTYGEGAIGMLSDVQIVRGCADAHDMYVAVNAEYAEKLIRQSMTSFEEKMKTFTRDNVLTNVADAYKLYDEASRYLDAIRYGGAEVDFEYLTNLNQSLMDAVNGNGNDVEGMQKYENGGFTTTTAQVNSKDVPANAASNILYIDDLSTTTYGSLGNSINLFSTDKIEERYGLYYGDAVLLYDGSQHDYSNIMALPVVYNNYTPNSTTAFSPSARLHGMYPCTAVDNPANHPYFRLIGNAYSAESKVIETNQEIHWYGYTTGTWDKNNFSLSGDDWVGADAENNNHFDKTQANSYRYGEYFITATIHYWYNVLQFEPEAYMQATGKDTPEGVYQLAWALYQARDTKNTSFATAEDRNKGYIDKTSSSIYVIDISKVKDTTKLFDSVDDFYNKMQNITDYSSESALALAEAVDGVTNFQLSSYEFSRGMVSTVYQKLIADRDEILANFASASGNLEMVDMADHAQLKEDVDPENPSVYAEAIADLENGNKYTTSSSNELIDKYQDAVDYFNSLDPSDANKNQPYADVNESTPDKLHDALDDAYKKLHEKADYTELNQIYAEKGHETLTTGDVQNATISSWIPYEEAATNAMKLSDNKDTNNAATYTVAQKDDQPKYATDPATGYQMTDTNSDIQNTINATADALNKAELKPVDTDEAYEVYCTAQATAQTADPSAYVDSAAIRTVQNYGLPDKAPEYTDGIEAVYVEYNGKIYKNTTTGETSVNTDNYTNRVLTAINGDKKTYDVTFNVLLDGKPVEGTVLMNDKAVANGTTEQHIYGDLVKLSYATPDGARLVSWVVEKEGITTAINNTEETFTTKIQKDTVITLNFVSDSKETVAIEMQDYFDRATLYNDIPVGTTATVNGDSIVLSTGQTLQAQACAYFTFTHWTVTQAGVTTKANDGDAIVINADTVFHAEGNRSADTMNYTFVGGTFADTKADKAAYPVDYRATAVADAVADGVTYYGIAMETRTGYTMLTYKDSYDFYAYPVSKEFESLGGVNLVAITSENIATYFSGDDNQTTVTAKAPMSFGVGVYNASDNKFMMFCNLTDGLNEDEYKVVERGIVYTNKQLSEDAFVKGAAGVVTNVSSTDLRDIQYMFTKTGVKETANRYARSYVSYEHYVHMNGMDVVIPMTSYGPIIALENGEIQ